MQPKTFRFNNTSGLVRFGVISLLTLGCFGLEQGVLSLNGLDAAHAQGRKQRVALFVIPSKGATPEVATVIQTLVRKQLGGLQGIRVLTGSPDPVTSVEAQLLSAVESGYRELNDRKYAKAKTLFRGAYDGLIRFEGPVNERLMARTVKGLAVSLTATGEVAKGTEMMRTCYNLWPGQDPADYAYTLDVQGIFKDIAKQAANEARGKVDVVSDPPRAVVRLNGVVKGYTPFTIEEAAAGPNWISVQLDGHIRQGAFVDVQAGKMSGHGFALQPVRNVAAYKTLMRNVQRTFKRSRKVGKSLKDLRTFLRADGIIFLKLTARRGYSLKGWYVGADATAIPLSGIFNPGATLLQDIQAWLAQALNRSVLPPPDQLPLDAPPQASVMIAESDMLFIDPDDPILQTKKEEVKDPITGKWWFWAIIGSATAGMAGMVVALLGDQGVEKGPVGNLSIKLHDQ